MPIKRQKVLGFIHKETGFFPRSGEINRGKYTIKTRNMQGKKKIILETILKLY